MTETTSHMRLYNELVQRLYINASERERFLKAACSQEVHIQAFCLTLVYTGCRLSEAREITKTSIQREEQLIAIRSLKKRNKHHIREIPVPKILIDLLLSLDDEELWNIDRITAYRWVKQVMNEAGIYGPQACPKGLRHGFGIHAVLSGIQIHMLQKWMGHAHIRTTAIYATAVGREEFKLAEQMWH